MIDFGSGSGVRKSRNFGTGMGIGRGSIGEGGGTPTVRSTTHKSNGGGGGNLENAWVRMGADVGFMGLAGFSSAPLVSCMPFHRKRARLLRSPNNQLCLDPTSINNQQSKIGITVACSRPEAQGKAIHCHKCYREQSLMFWNCTM
jgi:hypothetical protein